MLAFPIGALGSVLTSPFICAGIEPQPNPTGFGVHGSAPQLLVWFLLLLLPTPGDQVAEEGDGSSAE